MPTMPLNQLTFLSQVLAVWFAVISGPIECQSHGHLDLRSEAGFSPQRECDSLTIAWLAFHCTVSAGPTHRLFVLQLRNGLGTVPENDFTPLQQRAARSGCSRFFLCSFGPLLLRHPKCAGRPLRWFANWPKL